MAKKLSTVETEAVLNTIDEIGKIEEKEPEELKQIESGEVKAEVVDEDNNWLSKTECCDMEWVAPSINPIVEKPYATINWKDYTLDSDNSDLLEDVVWGKEKNAQTWQWEDKMFKYLPAKHIYTLMDALFDTYDFKSEPMKFTGEEYTTKKKKYNNQTKKREETEETLRVYEKTVRIVTTVKINDFENVIRETVGYAQWVASLSILTNDSARNWFANKLAFRARKEALKNLWKVFRTYEYGEDENTFVAEETTSVEGKSIADVKNIAEASNEKNEWREKIAGSLVQINSFFSEWISFTEEELTRAMFAVKADLGITPDKKDAMDAFKDIYNELKVKATK